jgi:putative NADH-flavin reductase
VVAVKVLIVGATGGLGMEMLRRAPERRHEATALARDPSTVQRQDERLQAVRGDVLDPASVESAVRGQDAVLSALGTPNPRKTSTLLSEGTKNLVDAMKRNGVERLVCVTILGTGDSGRRHGRLFYTSSSCSGTS